ncbi:DUF1298 domain-containing protein, partial [Amycolatopsis rhizosphaerae]
VHDLPPPGDTRELQEFVAAERSRPLDQHHPLWVIHLLRGYRGGSAMVMRSHHAMADGIRLTQVMFSMFDPIEEEPAAPAARVGGMAPHHEPTTHPAARFAAATLRGVDQLGLRLDQAARRLGPVAQAVVALPALGTSAVVGAAGAAVDLATSVLPPGPRRLADAVANTGVTVWHSAGSVAKLFGFKGSGRAWEGEPGEEKTAAWGEPVPLSTISRISRATGTTVNDVCTALVAGAMDRYLARDRPARGIPRDMTWMLPVSLSRFDAQLPPTLGNHFSLVLAHLPLGRGGFHERLAEVHRRVLRIRDSYEPVLTLVLQQLVSQSPPAVAAALIRYFTDKAVGVLTNVPGPRSPMAVAGAKVAGVVGWAPCSGRQAITVCIFSYAGQVFFGFGTDRRLLPDPERLVAALEAEVEEAKALAERSVIPLRRATRAKPA